jgi:hypothetical protein
VKKLVSVAALVVAVVAVGVRLEHVYDTYGVWQLTAPDIPNRIRALGRDYDRSDVQPLRSTPPDLVERGETAEGGALLVPEGASAVPLVVYVRDHKGQVWEYGLVGGP